MASTKGHDPANYRIRLRGHLDPNRAATFGGMTVTHETMQGQATTLLSGNCDQAALHGILARVRDMGLELLLVEQMSPSGSGVTNDPQRPQLNRLPPDSAAE